MHTVKPSTKRIRFGLVGAGRIAETYAQAFQASRNASLAAVTDARQEAAQAFAARNQCPSFSSLSEMTKGVELDAVVVATPPASQSRICLELLHQGYAVLCEKPFSVDVESAREIRDVSNSQGTLFTMASKFRYVDDVARARSIVGAGILGEVVLLENTFMSRVDMTNRWNADARVSGGGVLIDNGTHSVDMMRYFLGPLKEIYVMEGKRNQRLNVEETVRVLARSASDVIASADLSWSVNKEIDHYMAIYGSHGTLRLGWRQSTYRQAGSSEWIVFGNGYDKLVTVRHQIENFSAAMQGLEPLVMTADDALASVEAIQAGYQALRDRCRVSVPHIDDQHWPNGVEERASA